MSLPDDDACGMDLFEEPLQLGPEPKRLKFSPPPILGLILVLNVLGLI